MPKGFLGIACLMLLWALNLSRRGFCSRSGHDIATAIAELNKEMESVFGESPSTMHSSSTGEDITGEEHQHVSPKIGGSGLGLTHVGSKGEAQMVDVTPKESTRRAATASCKVVLGKKVFDLVSANQMVKGDVLSVANIAGINGAKQTSNLIPLCHNIILTHVQVDLKFNPNDFSVEIVGEATSIGKTGVEMEALTVVSVAGLTVYDMCKAASKDIKITGIQLEHKTGSKTGDWSRKE